jgi:hypothetical protein
VVDVDGANDRVLLSLPHEKAHFQNLHLSWPRKVDDCFVAGFFPSASRAAALPAQPQRVGRGGAPPANTTRVAAAYAPPLDEILMVRLDGTTKYLARTHTVFSAPAGRGRSGDMFWAQPLPRPNADGKRICFNSNRSGTIDLHILYTTGGPPPSDP